MKRSTILLTLGVVIVFFVALSIAFAGGMVLSPYITGHASADTTPAQSGVAIAPAATTDGDILAQYEDALTNIYETAIPSVVKITVTVKEQMPVQQQFGSPFSPFGPFGFTPPQPQERFAHGEGSGFVWDTEGHIVTNNHVVENATDVEVEFADGTTAPAKVVSTDPDADLAVIQVDLPADQLKPLPLGDSDTLKPGQLAIALGNPFGQEFSMTRGIISAVGRTIKSGTSPFSIPEVIQTDAAINPGNSGGPLLNRKGEVVGINTMILSKSGSSSGIGFAVPINIAKKVVPTLIKGEKVAHAWLGITGTTLTPDVAQYMKVPEGTKGVLVINVAHDSPADKAGLRGSDKVLKVAGDEYPLGGDVITAIDGKKITEMDDLITYLMENTKPGDTVKLTVIRENGKEETVKVKLEARPSPEDLQQQQMGK